MAGQRSPISSLILRAVAGLAGLVIAAGGVGIAAALLPGTAPLAQLGKTLLEFLALYAGLCILGWAAFWRLPVSAILVVSLGVAGAAMLLGRILLHAAAPFLVMAGSLLFAHLPLGELVFYGLAALAVLSGAGVAFSRNVIYSALSLLGSLMGVGGLYIYLSADVIAVTQLLIYVGGVLVLILFAIMLTNHLSDDPGHTNPSIGLPAAAAAGAVVLGVLGYLALGTRWPTIPRPEEASIAAALGNTFLKELLLPFEIASVLLLCALIGSVVVARKEIEEPGSRS